MDVVRRSWRIRSRRNRRSQPSVRSTTQRCTPSPPPCSTPRRARAGVGCSKNPLRFLDRCDRQVVWTRKSGPTRLGPQPIFSKTPEIGPFRGCSNFQRPQTSFQDQYLVASATAR